MNNLKYFKKSLSFLFITVILITENILFCFPITANQNHTIKDKVFTEKIKTVQVFIKGNELSLPVIQQNTREKLIIAFDDLSPDMVDYQYKIYHCDANWNRSDLYFNDYAEGFEENPIDNYAYSMNTFVKYTHYELELPNDDIRLLLPGNYVIVVYENDEQNPVFTRRFFVVSNQVRISPKILKPNNSLYADTHQEIRLDLELGNLQVENPREDIKLTIYQNGLHGHSAKNVLPEFYSGQELHYEDESLLIFPGKREYLNFDLKSLDYQTPEIEIISYQTPYFHIYLKADKLHKFDPYFYNEDLNGNFLIKNDKGFESKTEADYVYVNFKLPMEYPIMEGGIYLNGTFTIGGNPEDYKMEYNFENKAYEKQLFLKQGYYNYEYMIIGPKDDKLLDTEYQDNFFETENNYIIFIYQKDYSMQYDKLIGYKIINTLKQ